jgi:hypothetical protein
MSRIAVPMLALALSLAPIFCGAAEPNPDQARVIAEIRRFRGTVTVDEKKSGRPVIAVKFNGIGPGPDNAFPLTDDGLAILKRLTQLQSLNLWNNIQITDAGLKHLEGLTSLQSLNLYGTDMTDAGLEHLEGLIKLQSLILSNPKVTDAGLAHLKRLSQLKNWFFDRICG